MPEERLKKHVRVLSGDIGERNFSQHQNLEAAANYIKQEFQDYGYTVQEQVFFIEDKPYRNIIAGRQAKVKKVIIVCAHYDSVWGSPGADDNASGIAGLLEIAQLISKDNLNKTIKFIAFTNEEPPFFMTNGMGSLRYAQEARKTDEDIEAVLCLESIGFYSQSRKSQGYPFGLGFFYPDEGDFIGFVSNLGSADLLRKMVREFRKVSCFPLEYLVAPIFLAQAISFSDHWAFWKFGYKAVMITDTAFYRNPHYHTMADTVEKLDYQGMHQVVEGLYGALLSLSK